MIEFLKGLSQIQLLVLIILATVIIIEIVYNIIRAVREKKEYKKIYGRIDWLPDPSSSINDEMLNKMDYSVAKVDDLRANTIHAGVGYDYVTDEKGRIQICPLPMDTSYTYHSGDIVFKDGKTYVVLGDKFVEVR